MELLHPDPDPADTERIAIEAARTTERLRSMSLARLRAALPEGDTRSDRALRLSQEFADATAELAGWPRRELPDVPDTAAGDVLAVCATDLVEQLRLAPDAARVRQISAWAGAALIALRRLL